MIKFSKFNRLFHRWGSILIALPVLLVIVTGILLLLKKDSDWIQPPTQTGSSKDLLVSFDQVLEVVRSVPEAEVESWQDVDRLDVRPGKGMLKLRSKNGWEVQVDSRTGEVLQTAYRRTDLIESLHDGSFFHDKAKLGLFLPSALVLLGLWLTGIYLFLLPSLNRRRRQNKQKG
ncbi:PepSY domain-containing protein [Verrucomicrobiaceae bacterium N1E253]|uniref:PepSY domain-containing protein n=1 Tax=Oceaniferula marina TaxID=2748318 RepID=A0A851GD10_9BACT|nr:PepSY-associated TM helix domain-containing protein [Oceaniferula marina]NWK55306.1 PepSY domain-containing protein [Oceaniferula marina]